jgi:hypothetical protein
VHNIQPESAGDEALSNSDRCSSQGANAGQCRVKVVGMRRLGIAPKAIWSYLVDDAHELRQ